DDIVPKGAVAVGGARVHLAADRVDEVARLDRHAVAPGRALADLEGEDRAAIGIRLREIRQEIEVRVVLQEAGHVLRYAAAIEVAVEVVIDRLRRDVRAIDKDFRALRAGNCRHSGDGRTGGGRRGGRYRAGRAGCHRRLRRNG